MNDPRSPVVAVTLKRRTDIEDLVPEVIIVESGSRGFLAPGPHTTQHAGPHWAVHDEGAHGSLKCSHELSSTDRGR